MINNKQKSKHLKQIQQSQKYTSLVNTFENTNHKIYQLQSLFVYYTKTYIH